MSEDYLVETITMDCPICGNLHPIEKRIRETQILVKDEPVTYKQVYFVCPQHGDSEYSEFVPGNIMDENLLNARNEYRKSHGLLTSVEIKEIRLVYGLTQAEFSKILGIGEVTISRFETKAIQTKVLDDTIRQAINNKPAFLKKLSTKQDFFDANRFAEIESRISKLIADEPFVFNIQTITFSNLQESNFSNYDAFSCYEAVWNISEDYDLLPAKKEVSFEKASYYYQAQCEDSTFYNAAA